MSEITKLYENAGLSNMWVERYNDGYYEHERYYNSYKEMINNMMKANDWTLTEAQEVAKRECRKEHPPFTAEKQIAILQLLTQQCDLTISHFREWEFIHYDGQEPLKITGKDFTETFAKLINAYWQDLTEEEKASIKNILEM